MMNPVCKRLRFSPPPSSIEILRPQPPSLPLLSHDALLLPPPPPPAEGGAEEADSEGYLLVEEDTTDSSLIITMDDSRLGMEAARTKVVRKRKLSQGEEDQSGGISENEEEEARVEIDRQLDQSLKTKSKQHNLTTVNVRNILHEVITNEHVVAMMKAAINETEAVPPFEPKMTRSKFKEVVEKGVVIPAWNISPIKKTSDVNKAPQFVDIPLAEDDSSDEEYHPDEEEEDETAEDTFQESDMESTTSSPRGSRLREDSCSPWQMFRSQTRTLRKRSVSMGPPPPPKGPSPKAVTDSTFLEKLHAVEEELAVCMEPYQVRLENTRVTWNNPSKHQEPLSESEEEVAYRTRSKRPLRDVPLGRLEAELQAPDITPDMYDPGSAHEDREWTDWLRGLMSSDMDNEEECDDEDDPEYNFLADIDEPDLEDYRDDKAVRITKKEVNELMEELFETLKEDLAGQEVDDEGPEEEDEPQEETKSVQMHTPEEQHHILCCKEVDDGSITELRTVKQQLNWIRSQPTHTLGQTRPLCAEPHTLKLDAQQKVRLQQQLQQHIQLLTQIHLLSSPVSRLHSEAETTRQFLFELDVLAQRSELLLSSACPGFCSIYRASNLQGALQLLEELRQTPISYTPLQPSPDARGHMRCFPIMPAELAWLFATRRVFLYPELLPCVSLDPALYCPRRTAAFTAAEDCLLALGLRNMEGTCDPTKLVSQFLLRKTVVQVRRRILQCCRPGFPDNIVKVFRYQRRLWPMPVVCGAVSLSERRPPVEREESVLPLWLVRSLPVIYQSIKQYNSPPGSTPEALPSCKGSQPRQSQLTFLRAATNIYTFSPRTTYPTRLPNNLDFRRIGFILLQQPLPPFPHADPTPLFDRQIDLSFPPPTHKPCPPRTLSRPQFLLHRLVLTRIEPLTDIISTPQFSMTTTERIRHHYQTLASLRRRRRKSSSLHMTPTAPPASTACGVQSEPAFRTAVDEEGDDDDDDNEVTFSDESRVQAQESAENDDDDEDGQQLVEDEAFAQDYLQRVCEVVQVSTGMSEQLLQVLDQFSVVRSSETVEHMYVRLSRVLRRWPQLLRDFAAFLNREQAQRCGLLLEQQLFECSRRFLWQLRRRLGENSSLYQQVVSVLQGSPTLRSEDMNEICSLLQCHPDLQEALQQLYAHPSPLAISSETTESTSHNLPQIFRGETGGAVVCARNVSMTSSGEKVVIWTREVDRTILTLCQQRGASRKTFRQISAHLGNKTTQQVSLRFQQLMNLFQKSTSHSPESISRQEAVPD